MGQEIEKKCDRCGNDNWEAIDNIDAYYLSCINCCNISRFEYGTTMYNKFDYIDNFQCPYCGSNLGKPVDTDESFSICCSNCNKTTLIFEKPIITLNNRVKSKRTFEQAKEDDKIARRKLEELKNPNILRCPKCGSTIVSTGARGFSMITGFLGSGQTVNRCGNCGHVWKPKKK